MGCLRLYLVLGCIKDLGALLINGRYAEQHITLIPAGRGQQVGNSAHNASRVRTRILIPFDITRHHREDGHEVNETVLDEMFYAGILVWVTVDCGERTTKKQEN